LTTWSKHKSTSPNGKLDGFGILWDTLGFHEDAILQDMTSFTWLCKVSPMGMIGGVPVGMQMPGWEEGDEFNVVQPCAGTRLLACAPYVKTC